MIYWPVRSICTVGIVAAFSLHAFAQQAQRFDVPPIASRGDARFGKPPVRPQSLADVITEVGAIGKRGTWKIDKRWEVIINSLTSAEIEQVVDAVAKLSPSDARETLRGALYSRWGECDPAAAMRRIGTETDPVTRGVCLQLVLQGWAHANADEVLAWAEQLPPGDAKLIAYIAATPYQTANTTNKSVGSNPGTLSTTTTHDPRVAVAEAAKILDRDRRLTAYKQIAKEWAAADPAAASNWALELSMASEREATLEVTTNVWARAHPDRALSFMAARAAVPRPLTERAFLTWAQRDFPAASSWARQLPDPKQCAAVFLAPETDALLPGRDLDTCGWHRLRW